MKPKTPKPIPQNRIAELLGTDNVEQQTQAIQGLLNIASSAQMAITITVNAFGKISGLATTQKCEATVIMQVLGEAQAWLGAQINSAKPKNESVGD